MVDFRLELVNVPVSDVDRAKAFYVETLGFTVKFDYVMDPRTPGPPDPAPTSPWSPGSATPVRPDRRSCPSPVTMSIPPTPRSPLVASDPTTTSGRPMGRWFGIDDLDGNNWLIVETR